VIIDYLIYQRKTGMVNALIIQQFPVFGAGGLKRTGGRFMKAHMEN
jgi:hypothetical protein